MDEDCLGCGDPVEASGPFGRRGSGQSVYVNVRKERPRGTRKREWLKVGYLCLRCSIPMVEEAREAKHPLRVRV